MTTIFCLVFCNFSHLLYTDVWFLQNKEPMIIKLTDLFFGQSPDVCFSKCIYPDLHSRPWWPSIVKYLNILWWTKKGIEAWNTTSMSLVYGVLVELDPHSRLQWPSIVKHLSFVFSFKFKNFLSSTIVLRTNMFVNWVNLTLI